MLIYLHWERSILEVMFSKFIIESESGICPRDHIVTYENCEVKVVFIILKMMVAVKKCLICSIVIVWLERREYRKRITSL